MSDEPIASAEARLLEKHIDNVERLFGEYRRKNEEAHMLHAARFSEIEKQLSKMEVLPEAINEVKDAITEHITALARIDNELAMNTATTMETQATTRENKATAEKTRDTLAELSGNLHIVVAMVTGTRKTLAIAKFITGAMAIFANKVSAFLASAIVIALFVLWAMGNGPLPHP